MAEDEAGLSRRPCEHLRQTRVRLRRKLMLAARADERRHQSAIRRVVSRTSQSCRLWPEPAVPRSGNILLIPNR